MSIKVWKYHISAGEVFTCETSDSVGHIRGDNGGLKLNV